MGAKSALSVEQYLHTSFPDLDKEYRDGDLVVRPPGDTIAALATALGTVAGSAHTCGLAYSPAARTPQAAPPAAAQARQSSRADGYLAARPDGTFTKVVYAAERPHTVPASQAAELSQLLGTPSAMTMSG